MKQMILAILVLTSVTAQATGISVIEVKETRNGVKVKLQYNHVIPVLNKLGLLGPSLWHRTVTCIEKDNELIANVKYSRKAIIDKGEYIQDPYPHYKSFNINVKKLCDQGLPSIVEVHGKRVI